MKRPGPALRIALFVEGSETPSSRRGDNLKSLWVAISKTLGALPPDLVFPISKKLLIALSHDLPAHQQDRMSGAAEGLDDLMRRQLAQSPFDLAIVAWDLAPPWAMRGDVLRCRWNETKSMYAHMARRARLPEPFLSWVQKRTDELESRTLASARSGPPARGPGAILPLCMESCFESWFVDERAGLCSGKNGLRQALDVSGRQLRGWPGPFKPGDRRDAKGYVEDAIHAARRLRPPPAPVQRIQQSWITNQEGWATYLAQTLHTQDAAAWCAHPIAQRLSELLPSAAAK